MVIFNSYVKLPEGNLFSSSSLETWYHHDQLRKKLQRMSTMQPAASGRGLLAPFLATLIPTRLFVEWSTLAALDMLWEMQKSMTGSLGNLTVSQKRPSMPFKESRSVQKTLQNGCLNEVVAYNSFTQDTSGLQSPREIASTGDWGVLDPVVHTFASELSTHLGSHTDEIALTLGGWSWCRDLLTVICGRLDGFYRLRIVLYIYIII